MSRRTAAYSDEFDVTRATPGRATRRAAPYLQQLFAEQIDGHPPLVNNSRWGNFRTRRARRWWHRTGGTAIALLGDAGAHCPLRSVLVGTKMAMEDAIALAKAVAAHPDDPTPRSPSTSRYVARSGEDQDSARPSLSWWEHSGFGPHDTLPGWQFAYHSSPPGHRPTASCA
jgi:anthraniloyl-CoA monooxygenase